MIEALYTVYNLLNFISFSMRRPLTRISNGDYRILKFLSKTVGIIKIEYDISNKFSKNYVFVSTQSYTLVPTNSAYLKQFMDE